MTHRIYVKSTRLRDWDYTSAAWYFVTICTRGRLPTLGQIIEGNVHLSPAGRIVSEEWLRTQDVRANVSLDEFVVMPNHFHGIIVIEESGRVAHLEASHRDASTRPRLYSNSLGSVIGQFKSIATKRIWDAGFREFAWQSRFHDHIIRSEPSQFVDTFTTIRRSGRWTKIISRASHEDATRWVAKARARGDTTCDPAGRIYAPPAHVVKYPRHDAPRPLRPRR